MYFLLVDNSHMYIVWNNYSYIVNHSHNNLLLPHNYKKLNNYNKRYYILLHNQNYNQYNIDHHIFLRMNLNIVLYSQNILPTDLFGFCIMKNK